MSLIPFLMIVPLGGAFLTALLGGRFKKLDSIILCLTAMASMGVSYSLIFSLGKAERLIYQLNHFSPPFGLSLIVDGFSGYMLITVNTVAFLTAIYSVSYIKKYTDEWKFNCLFLILISGINGVLLAGDIFNLYIFMEIAAIAGYFLVAFGTDADGLEASFKYAVMGAVASSFILLGIALVYMFTSTLNMADIASVLISKGQLKALLFVSVLFIMGFGLKAALVPFHAWLPYAHSSAPAPVSAMLSGVSIKVLGVYALARIFFNIFGMTPAVSHILIILAVLSMVVGSLMAFGQSDIKRLFAYSSISQIGYIVLGLAIGTPLAILGALFHLFNHSMAKSLLFLNAGAIEHHTGTRDLNKIRGLMTQAPVIGWTNLLGALSICGMPPFGGFWSKLIIILACVRAGHPMLAFIAAFVSILTLGYYFRALTPALFGNAVDGDAQSPTKDLVWTMAIPMIVLAFISLVGGFMMFPLFGQELLTRAADVLASGINTASALNGVLR